MTVFVIAGAIVGILLGFRFKVSMLGLAILFAIAVMVMNGIIGHHRPAMILLTSFSTGASLQIGYFVGCILRYATAHLTVPPTVTLSTPQDRSSELGSGSLLHH
jgi:hypothetical protein